MKKLLFSILLTLIPVMSFFSRGEIIKAQKAYSLDKREFIAPESNYKIEYEKLIAFIKVHEGFVDTAYYCAGGCRTIGHGLVTRFIGKNFRNDITLEQSDSIVRYKIDKGIKRAKKRYPGFDEYQYLVISHLFFCKGAGRIYRHALNRELKRGYINKYTLLHFSRHEVAKPHYRKTRNYEWKLWNYKKFINNEQT